MFMEKRGYSLVMWVVVFAIVISATVMFVTPVKEEGGWNHNQIGAIETTTGQHLVNKNLENKGQVRTILIADSDTTSSYSSY